MWLEKEKTDRGDLKLLYLKIGESTNAMLCKYTVYHQPHGKLQLSHEQTEGATNQYHTINCQLYDLAYSQLFYKNIADIM